MPYATSNSQFCILDSQFCIISYLLYHIGPGFSKKKAKKTATKHGFTPIDTVFVGIRRQMCYNRTGICERAGSEDSIGISPRKILYVVIGAKGPVERRELATSLRSSQ